MPFYHKLGEVPHKRHTLFRKPNGELYREEVMGLEGFSSIQSILYHNFLPPRVKQLADLGSRLPETVEFFSQFKCRLHFVDLFHEPFVAGQADLSERELRHAFEQQLRFPADTRFDICLFWDFMSYLDDPALRAFNAALRPWLHGMSRGYGFGAHHLAVRLTNVQYGVRDQETLSVRERFTTQMRSHPHSHTEMHEMFSCFDFQRGLLLPDGKLEMLLKART